MKAVDTSPETVHALADEDRSRLQIVQGTLHDADIANESIDLVNARLVFPFMQQEELLQCLEKIGEILQPGGYLCATFFGPSHSWSSDGRHPQIAFHSRPEIEDMLKKTGLVIREIRASHGSRPTASGGHVPIWHEIAVFAQRPEPSCESPSLATRLRTLWKAGADPNTRKRTASHDQLPARG